jgi:protein-disulfide isomerase
MMRQIWFALLGLIGFILVAPERVPSAAPHVIPVDAQAVLALNKDDRILGNPDAPITIIEYASLTCPHCAHFTNEVLPELKKKWIDTGKVKLVLRDYPLDQLALQAAMIARCAPPDRYYAFIDALFQTQQKWVTEHDNQDALARLAKLGGMGKDEFDHCLKDTALENKILEERLTASKELDVNSTPTFFINGTKFAGAPTAEEFDKALSGLSAKS